MATGNSISSLVRVLAYLRPPQDGPDSLAGRVYAEQVALLYKQSPLAFIITIVNGSILVYIQKEHVAEDTLALWLSVLFFITLLRVLLSSLHRKTPGSSSDPSRWLRFYLVGVVLAGVVWGSTAVFLFPQESLAHQIFVVFILAGMSAGGVTILSSRLEASVLFVILVILPLAIQCFRQGSELQTAMGAMTTLFLIGMIFSAWTTHAATTTALQLRFDNRALHEEIEQRLIAEENLYQEKERLQITMAAIGDGVLITDSDGRIVYLNPAVRQMIGAGKDQILRAPAADVIQVIDEHSENSVPIDIMTCIQSNSPITQNGTLVAAGKNDFHVEILINPLFGRYGNCIGSVCILRDVTANRRRTDRLIYEARHDALTGLPNRNLLSDRLNQAMLRSQRTDVPFALLFVDLDKFKQVNDELGHAAGDELLRQTALRLSSSIRAEDTLARFGGDEFVVILEHIANPDVAAAIAEKILSAMSRPFMLAGVETSISASIGISLYLDHDMDAEALLKDADRATYQAKAGGRNQARTAS